MPAGCICRCPNASRILQVVGLFPTTNGGLAVVWPLAQHRRNKNAVIVRGGYHAQGLRTRIFYTDTFSGFSVTGATPSPIVRTAGAYGYTASVNTSTFFGAGTVADPWLSTNLPDSTITFDAFSPAVSAIGGFFFGSEVNGRFQPDVSITLVATDADASSLTETISNSTENSFRGFVSTKPLTSLTVTAVQLNSPWPTVEDLTLAEARATAVPEPESAALLLAALGLMGTMARRRRN